MKQFLNNKGFSLVETIMIIVLVAVAIPAIVMMMGQSSKQSGAQSVQPELRITASNLAQGMMEEIRSKRWDELAGSAQSGVLGPEGGESRTACTGIPNTFDDIDDYNGLNENCPYGGVIYNTTVFVCYVDQADLNTCVAGTRSYKRIIVTVSNTLFGTVELVSVMTDYKDR